MLTLLLQILSALLTCLFGWVALAITRHDHILTPDRRAGWLLTGIGFSLLGASAVLQDVGAVAAFASGSQTAVYDAYVRVAPALNHSRTALAIALGAGLTVLAWSGSLPSRRGWRWTTGALVAAMVLGGAIGFLEGPYVIGRHATVSTVLLTVELIAFALALLASASRGTFDIFLFASLMFYALMGALNVSLMTGMAWRAALPGGGPPPWLLQLQNVLFLCVMLGVATVRLVLLEKGLRVREVFGREAAPARPIRFFEPARGGGVVGRRPGTRRPPRGR